MRGDADAVKVGCYCSSGEKNDVAQIGTETMLKCLDD